MTAKHLMTEAYVFACELQRHLRGKRKKYLKRAWKIVRHLPHWQDGPTKGVALGMLVLLLVAAARAKPKGSNTASRAP